MVLSESDLWGMRVFRGNEILMKIGQISADGIARAGVGAAVALILMIVPIKQRIQAA
jgi:hypothetical protein